MKIYGGIIIDYLSVPKYNTLPIWSIDNIGQIIYCITEDDFYLGTQSNWVSLKIVLSHISTGGTGATGATGNVGATGFSGKPGGTGNIGGTGATGGTGIIGGTGGIGYIGGTGGTGPEGKIGNTGPPGFTTTSGGTGDTGNTGGTGRLLDSSGLIGEHEYGTILGFIEIVINFISLTTINLTISDIFMGFDILEFNISKSETKNNIILNSDATIISFLNNIVDPKYFKEAVSNIVYNDTTNELKIHSNIVNKNIEYRVFDLLQKTYIPFTNLAVNKQIIIHTKFIISNGEIPIYTLTIIIIHGLGTVISYPSGINCPTICNYNYDKDSEITLISIPDLNYEFIEYIGVDSTKDNFGYIKLNNNKTIQVYFSKKKYKLFITISGNGKITGDSGNIDCLTSCSYIYETGTTISLLAIPDIGWELTKWEGYTLLISILECSIDMISENKFIDVVFSKISIKLQITVLTKNFGTVTGTNVNCSDNCFYDYFYEDSIDLLAISNSNYDFVNWTGDIFSILPNISFIIKSNMHITALFISNPILTITINNSTLGSVTSKDTFISCPSICSYTYHYNDSVELFATPIISSEFIDWTKDIISTNNPSTIIMTSNKTVNANFKSLLELTVDRDPKVGSIISSPIGIVCPTGCIGYYVLNTSVELTANDDESCIFLNWIGDFTTPDINYPNIINTILDKNKTLIAHFEMLPKLFVEINPIGSGIVISNYPEGVINCPTDCEAYADGYFPITIELFCSVVNEGYTFSNWTGLGTVDPLDPKTYLIVLDQIDQKVIANFIANMLTVIIIPSGEGSVKIDSTIVCTTIYTHIYPIDTIVNLEADLIGLNQHIFLNWIGDIIPSATKTKCTVKLNTAKTITAVYEKIKLDILINPPDIVVSSVLGTGINCPITCFNYFDYNFNTLLTAINSTNYIFNDWEGDCSPDSIDSRICTVKMDSSKTIIANFKFYPSLTITISPVLYGVVNGGVVSSIDTITCPSSCSHIYDVNASIKLTAISKVPDADGSTYSFANWTGSFNSSANPLTFNINKSTTLIANFIKKIKFTLTIIINNSSLGYIVNNTELSNCSGSCIYSYWSNDIVSLTAKLLSGGWFGSWSSNVYGITTQIDGSSCNVLMDTSKIVYVNFYKPTAGCGGTFSGTGKIDQIYHINISGKTVNKFRIDYQCQSSQFVICHGTYFNYADVYNHRIQYTPFPIWDPYAFSLNDGYTIISDRYYDDPEVYTLCIRGREDSAYWNLNIGSCTYSINKTKLAGLRWSSTTMSPSGEYVISWHTVSKIDIITDPISIPGYSRTDPASNSTWLYCPSFRNSNPKIVTATITILPTEEFLGYWVFNVTSLNNTFYYGNIIRNISLETNQTIYLCYKK